MASFGETLKRERELREISLRQISEATKISIRYLEALEQNRFELLPGGLFNKGFIRAYATYVGLDGESMVNTYLHQIAASGPLPEPGSGRPQPGLHRPSEVPQRRVQRPESSAPAASPSPASQAPAVGRETAAARETGVGRDAAAGRESAMGRDAAAWRETAAGRDAALGRVTHDAALPQEPGFDRTGGAVRGTEALDRTAASSRALLWIFSLVAGAGVVFLILTLATGRSPQDALPQDTSPHDASPQGASPLGTSSQGTSPQAASLQSTSPQDASPPAAPAAPAIGTSSESAPSGAPVTETKPSEPPLRAGSRVDSAPAPAPAPTVASVGGRQAESPAPQDARSPRDEDWPLEEEHGPSRRERQPRGVAMELQVEASSSAWIQVTCDAERVVDGMMHPGESLTTQCLNVIRVSATDAGAVGLSINGAACLPLGEPGTRVYGYTIRSDDFRRICPPSGRGVDDRR